MIDRCCARASACLACGVYLVTNIQLDHPGLKGVDTIEDLAQVKSVVVEAVLRNGASILNAYDPATASMHLRAEMRDVRKVMPSRCRQ
ncbi:hypothetical protein [Microvirga sp. TS319]|uniref:hypothetical protein n=1 Tax=Microvirga sp. TS319 TaxID=3241165 RepID=UPI003519DB3F